MYISSFRLGLLIFISIFLGFNIPMVITALHNGDPVINAVLNISGLAILGIVIVLNQVYQNRKRKANVDE
jgi:hypothetical protein